MGGNWEFYQLFSCTFMYFGFQNGSLVETWLHFFFGYFLFLEALNSSELRGYRIRVYFFSPPFSGHGCLLSQSQVLLNESNLWISSKKSMEIYLVIYLEYLGWFYSIYWEMASLFKLIFKEVIHAHNKIFRRYSRDFQNSLPVLSAPNHSLPQNH